MERIIEFKKGTHKHNFQINIRQTQFANYLFPGYILTLLIQWIIFIQLFSINNIESLKDLARNNLKKRKERISRNKKRKGNALPTVNHFLTFCLLAYDSHVLEMFR